MHLWFKSFETPLIKSWVRTEGTATDGVKKLDQKNVYWIPATSNFANIDAAFVCGSVLVCLQYTVMNQHLFNEETFWNDFAGQVHTTVPFVSVVIWFVSPKGTDFENTHLGYLQVCGAPETALQGQGPPPAIPVSFSSAEVTCDSTDTLNATAPTLGFLVSTTFTIVVQ